MKYTEFSEDFRPVIIKYIETQWGSLSEAREQALSHLGNYLFVLNTGGLATTAAYAAATEVTQNIGLAIIIYFMGVCFVLTHGVYQYYKLEEIKRKRIKEIEDFYADKLDWDDFKDGYQKLFKGTVAADVIGISAGVAFFAASLCAILGLLNKS